MYKVLSVVHGDGTLYALQDFTLGYGVEVVTESDLKLLIYLNFEAEDLNGDLVRLDGENLICNVQEYVGEGETEEEDYDFSDDEGEYEEEYEFSEDDEGEYEEADDAEEDYDFDEYFDYEDEFDDEEQEGSVVSKLYDLLSQEQITVLRRYYLWYSQRLFTDAQKDPSYGFKNKAALMRKKNALNNLRGKGDYRYAGFLDTGSKYEGYTCSLGHPLRYMHLAWDITVGDIEESFFGQEYNLDYEKVIRSNSCIVFGIKCIGDFFEVDKDCIASLQRAQRDSLKDMSILYSIYQNGEAQGYSDSLRLMDEVIKPIQANDIRAAMLQKAEPTIPFSVLSFYTQFRSVDLIPPKSLVQEIRSCLVGWTDGRKYFSNKWTGSLKQPDSSFYDRLKVIVGRKYSPVIDRLNCGNPRFDLRSSQYRLWAYVALYFTIEICGGYKYTATKEGYHDEGGYSKSVAADLKYLQSSSVSRMFTNGEFSLKFLKEVLDVCLVVQKFCTGGFEDAIEVHSRGEVFNIKRSLLHSMYSGDRGNGYPEPDSGIISFLDGCSGDRYENCLNSLRARELGDESIYTGSSFSTENYAKKLQERLDAYSKWIDGFVEHLESLSTENEKAISTRADVVEWLKNHRGMGDGYSFARQVLDTVLKRGTEPSDKQFRYLQEMYEGLSGQKYKGGEDELDDELETILRWGLTDECELAAKEHGVDSKDLSFALMVVNSVLKRRKISAKQMKYIDTIKSLYEKRR